MAWSVPRVESSRKPGFAAGGFLVDARPVPNYGGLGTFLGAWLS